MKSAPLHLVDTTMFWSPTGGGVRRYVETKHAWLATQPGWRHSIAVPRVGGADADADARTGRRSDVAVLPSIPLPFSRGYRLPLDRQAIAGTLVALAPDLIEAGDPYRVAWGALDAAAQRGIPAVAYCHSNLEALARLAAGKYAGRYAGESAARLARRYARHVYRRFDLVLAPSRSMTQHLVDWGISRVARQPLGVDSAAFTPARRSLQWRATHGFDASTRVLVYAGRFAAEKHLEVLADAVGRLGSPYALVAIGAGPMPLATRDRVRTLPFAGTAELATALASADAFVHAGDQETFGLSVLEAMACGTPAVVRAAGGLAELVDDGVGIAVDRAGGAAFAEGIAALFDGDRAAFASRARERAVALDWHRVLPDLLGHYARVLGRESATRTPAMSSPPARTVATRR